MTILKEKDEISMALKSIMLLLVVLTAGIVMLDAGASVSEAEDDPADAFSDIPECVGDVYYQIQQNGAVVCGFVHGIEDADIGDTVTIQGTEYRILGIADEAFHECKTLKRVRIGDIDSIGESAFYGCAYLCFVSLGSVSTIADDAFGTVKFYDRNENEITKNAENMSNRTFLGSWQGFYESYVGMTTEWKVLDIAIADLDTFEASVVGLDRYIDVDSIDVPAFVNIHGNGFRVTSIDDGVFKESDIHDADLGNVKTIGKRAFYGCPLLMTVYMDKATYIDERAFTKCHSLTEASINGYVGPCAFYGCTRMNTLKIYDGAEIDSRAFALCSGLEKVEFGSISSIASDAFNGVRFYGADGSSISCTAENLSGKTFIGSDGKLREYAEGTTFTYDGLRYAITSVDTATVALTGYVGSISYVIVPSTVELGPEEFEVTSIRDRAFIGCTEITGIYAPSVESVGQKAFYGCTNFCDFNTGVAGAGLCDVDVGERAFAYCEGISAVTANSVIGDFAFYGCSTIDNITFKDGASIGTKAFYGCDNF